MKHMTATLVAGILKLLNLSEILPFYLVHRLHYLVRFRGPQNINCYTCTICCSELWNLANWNMEKYAAENSSL